MSNETNHRVRAYTHSNKKEMMTFIQGYLPAMVLKKDNANLEALLHNEIMPGDTPEVKAANKKSADRTLYGIVIGAIDNEDLVGTLSSNYYCEGAACVAYIRGCFDEGDPDDNMSTANDGYLKCQSEPLTPTCAESEFAERCNQMHMFRTVLTGTPRVISDVHHCGNLIDMVKKIDDAYLNDVRHIVLGPMSAADKTNVPKVVKALTGIVRSRSAKSAEAAVKTSTASPDHGGIAHVLKMLASMSTDGLEPDEAAVIRKMMGGGGKKYDNKTKCPHCTIPHGGDWSKCFALLRSKGKDPPGWSEMPDDKRDRIDERAANIKAKPKVGHLAVKATTAGDAHYRAPEGMPAQTDGIKALYVDSQGGTGFKYHFIKDKELFSTMDESAPQVKVGGVTGEDHFVMSRGLGTCEVEMWRGPHSMRMTLANCLFVPDLDSNIFNVWHAVNCHGVHVVIDENPRLVFPDGDVFPMHDDYTVRVVASVPHVKSLDVSVITRGQHGATHIERRAMSETARVNFDFAQALLNDPAPARSKSLHKIMDNVPQELKKANYNNTATDARMLANGPAMPAPASKTPHATRAGEVTQIDGWDAGVMSLLGNKYMLDAYDAYTTDFCLYFAKKKSDFPRLLDQYCIEQERLHPGWALAGGVVWSDNEAVLVSAEMTAVAHKHHRTKETAIQYRPTSNAGAESVFRIVPNEMRKLYVRTGVPEQLFEFVALEAERTLRATREHSSGVSVGEASTGKRPDFLSLKGTFGCRVVARLPAPWRKNKHTPRSVYAVNLGKARNQPGWHIYSPEYGLMTSADVTFFHHVFPFKEGTIRLPAGKAQHPSAYGGGGGGAYGHGLTPMVSPTPVPPPIGGGVIGGDDDDGDEPDGGGPGSEVTATDDGADGDDDGDEYGDSDSSLHGPPTHTDVESSDGDDPPRGHGPVGGEADDLLSDDDQEAEAPTRRETRSAGVKYDHTMFGDAYKTLDSLSIKRFTVQVSDDIAAQTAARIEDHIARVMGINTKTKKQGDPDWVPPPWFDLNSIKDPEVRDRWMTPDLKEIKGLRDVGCATEVLHSSLTEEQLGNIIGCLTPRQVKRSGKDKSRVVARGDQMTKGLHYQRSHSPTIQHVSLRFMFALAAALGLEIIGGDFSQAYINADLPEAEWYYMWPPKSARQYDEDGNRIVWLVKKSLYGGVNAGRNWYNLMRTYLKSEGFEQCFCEPCIFFRRTTTGLIVIGVYVDDLVTLYSDAAEMRALYARIQERFDFTPQEPLVDMCGIEVKSTSQYIILTLVAYITKMAMEHLTEEERAERVHTPAAMDLPEAVDEALKQDAADVKPALLREFRVITGAILFAVTTVRADGAYASGMLGRAGDKPTPELLRHAKRHLQYLYTTREMGIRYSRKSEYKMDGSSDSDWAVKCSTSGYAFFMACAVVSFLSKKQPTIAMSSTQAEITASSLAALEGTFMINLGEQITGRSLAPIDLGIDSKGAADLAQDFVSNSRVRHFERRQFKIRELVERGLIAIKQIGTEENVSDIFTKPLGRRRFEKLRKVLLNMSE